MGEMADFYIAQEMDAYGWSPVGSYKRPKPVVCKHCGSKAVKWKDTDAGWRLFNTKRSQPGNRNVLHDCRSSSASADEFADCTPQPPAPPVKPQ